MAQVTKTMIYDLLMPMQDQVSGIEQTLSKIDGRLDDLTVQICGLQTGLNGVSGGIADIYNTLGRLDMRVTRIEKRLDIIEEPAE